MRVVMTPGGKDRLEARLSLVRNEYDEVVADNPAALEAGDNSGWHDNFAFEENQRRMHQLAHRVRDLERMLEQAEVVPALREVPDRVIIGAHVRWRFEDDPDDTVRELWLAGYEDGAPAEGRVSYDSPMGRALIGAMEGDLREVRIGEGTRWIEVLELGPTPADAGDRP